MLIYHRWDDKDAGDDNGDYDYYDGEDFNDDYDGG